MWYVTTRNWVWGEMRQNVKGQGMYYTYIWRKVLEPYGKAQMPWGQRF